MSNVKRFCGLLATAGFCGFARGLSARRLSAMTRLLLAVIFCLIILAFDLSRSWRRTFCPIFLSAVRAVAARCKLPFALHPGLSQERVK